MSQNIKNTSSSRKKIKECHSAEADALLECARSEGRHEPSSIDSAGDQSTQLCLNHFLTGHNWAKSKLQEFASTNKANCAVARYVNLACYEVKTLMELVEADGDSPSGQLNPLGNVAQFISAIYPKYGYSSLRVLRIEAKREVANVPRAALLDQKIQTVWDTWECVVFACLKHDLSANLNVYSSHFYIAIDQLRDYVEPLIAEGEESTAFIGQPSATRNTTAQPKPARRTRGRPRVNDEKWDDGVDAMWRSGCYRNFNELASELTLVPKEVPAMKRKIKLALDRVRKRRNKSIC